MIDDHLTKDVIERLVIGALSDESREAHLFHLIFCVECREELIQEFPVQGPILLTQAFGDDPNWVNPGSTVANDPALRCEVQAVPQLFDELARCPAPRRVLLIKNLEKFQTLSLAAACLSEAKRLWGEPSEAKSWAANALEILELLETNLEQYDQQLVAGLRARAWAYKANAKRNLYDFQGAEEDFLRAWEVFDKSSRDPKEWASIAALEASLRRSQRRFREAHYLLKDAIGIYAELGEEKEEARLLVARALVLAEEVKHAESVEVLKDLLTRFSRDLLGEQLYLAAVQNLATGLLGVNQVAEARALLPQVRYLAEADGGCITLVKVDWLEADICAAEGDDLAAISLYRSIKEEFSTLGIAYDAALVSLELAALYLKTNRLQETKELASQMLPIFRSRQIHREAATAGLVLVEALRREAATVELVEEVAAYMRSSRGGTVQG